MPYDSSSFGFKFNGPGIKLMVNGGCFMFISPLFVWFLGLQVNDPKFGVHCPKFQVTMILSLLIQVSRLVVGVFYLLAHYLHDEGRRINLKCILLSRKRPIVYHK